MVKEQKLAGYDFLKIHPGIKNESFASLAKTADEVGIPFAGHVPFDVGVWNAIDAKFASIDHLDGFIEAITPAASEMTEGEIGLFAAWIATKADTSLIPKLMKALQTNSIYVVPTEALAQRWLSPYPASHFEGDLEFKYMSKEVINAWVGSKNNHNKNPRFNKEEAEEFIKLRMKLINDCQKYGVKLLLGSDAPQVFNVPGFSIHREMEYMVNSGLTPYETLISGTVNVASYLNKEDAGMIKPGNVSDFVLLNSNPLVDISNTKDIEGVMIGTQWLSKDFIDKKLQEIEAKYQ
jgi:imidazolonepropionase-like amidohydrolase